MMNFKKNLLVLLIVVSFLVGGCTSNDMGVLESHEPDVNFQDNSNMVPMTGNVIAVVNGKDILTQEVEETKEFFKLQGIDISLEETLEQVINQKLISEKLKEEGYVVTTEEAEEIMQSQLSQQDASLEEYKELLETQGVSYLDELENVKEQIATQNFFNDFLKDKNIDVTINEAKEFYDNYKQQDPDMPPYEEIESQIIMALEQEKQQELINNYIQEIRETANIEYQ